MDIELHSQAFPFLIWLGGIRGSFSGGDTSVARILFVARLLTHSQLSLLSSREKVFTGIASATQASADWLALQHVNIFDRMSDIPVNLDKYIWLSIRYYSFVTFSHMVEMMRNIVVLVLALFCSLCFAHGKERKCEKIKIPMCQNIGYNLTYMPNVFNHDSQEEAALEVHQFWPLVEIKCSPDLKFFVCSMYAPMCQPNFYKAVPPCRSICKRARKGCLALMRQYGFRWPERMKCKLFPKLGRKKLCMDRNTTILNTKRSARPATITKSGPNWA